MVLGNIIFLAFAAATAIHVMGGGIALGVDAFNGITVNQLNELNPAIMFYSMHVHLVVAAFALSVAITGAALAWLGFAMDHGGH